MQEKKKRELPVIDSTEMPESLDCTTCFLPMQYQKKIDGKTKRREKENETCWLRRSPPGSLHGSTEN